MSKRFIRKDSIAPLCACGCGKRVKKSKLYPYNWNKFINGHGRRGKNWRKKPPDSEAPLCECGYCNERTKWNQGQNRWDRFIDRHQFRGKNNWSYGKIGKLSPRYGIKRPEHSEFMKGNQIALGTKHTKEFCRAYSKRMLALGDSHWMKTPQHRKRISDKMLNGQAKYMRSLNQKPSKPQIKLYELTKLLYHYESILDYSSLTYFIDIAIPDKMIAIEYDGSYWHQDKEEDDKRQKELENIGWKFLRYVDYVPSIDELKRDLQQIERTIK